MTPRKDAIEAAGRILAAGRRAQAAMSVTEAARAAYTPTGPSLAELELRIAAQRTTQTATAA